jgi:type VI protein secretion system component Hcp
MFSFRFGASRANAHETKRLATHPSRRRAQLGVERLENRTTPSSLRGLHALVQAPALVDGLTLSGITTRLVVKSFDWSITNTSASGVGGAGKPVPQDFHFVITATSVDPKLWTAVASGQRFQQAVFTQHEGSNVVQWTMTNVEISSFKTTGRVDDITLHFATVGQTVLHAGVQKSAAQFDFTSFTGAVTPPAASTTPTSTGLVLNGVGIPIAVQSYDWGLSVPVSTTGGAGKATPQDFHFVITQSAASPVLWYDVASGVHLSKAVFTVRQGSDLVQWTMNDVVVTSFKTENGHDEVTLSFGQLQEKITPPGKATPTQAGFDFRNDRLL